MPSMLASRKKQIDDAIDSATGNNTGVGTSDSKDVGADNGVGGSGDGSGAAGGLGGGGAGAGARATIPPRRDPLVLDLDGDDIETISTQDGAVILFDHDADGVKTGTAGLNRMMAGWCWIVMATASSTRAANSLG